MQWNLLVFAVCRKRGVTFVRYSTLFGLGGGLSGLGGADLVIRYRVAPIMQAKERARGALVDPTVHAQLAAPRAALRQAALEELAELAPTLLRKTTAGCRSPKAKRRAKCEAKKRKGEAKSACREVREPRD